MLGDWQKKKKYTSAGIEAIEIYCRECVCVCFNSLFNFKIWVNYFELQYNEKYEFDLNFKMS